MKWFSKSNFNTRIAKLLAQCGLQPKCERKSGVAVTISLDGSYLVQIEEYAMCARLTGHPNVRFSPGRCPPNLLAHLLLRNGESGTGCWRLLLSDCRVTVCYSFCIPLRQLSRTSLKTGLDFVLAEVSEFALEYGYFSRA